jgi:hypothetical protein
MKFKTNHNKFFKEWRSGDVRILNDVYANVVYHYEVQKFDGTRWVKVRSFRTLAEAKEAAAWVLDDMRADQERMC